MTIVLSTYRKLNFLQCNLIDRELFVTGRGPLRSGSRGKNNGLVTILKLQSLKLHTAPKEATFSSLVQPFSGVGSGTLKYN